MSAYVKFKAIVRRYMQATYLQACRSFDSFRKADISIFHKMMPPPDGGGNQFLRALWMEFERRGYAVENNRISRTTKACIFNSFNFDEDKLRALSRRSCRMVHRVDGPVDVYRGRDEGVDVNVQRMNDLYADATIFQSHYSMHAHLDAGLKFRSPVVIRNAVDPAIFHSFGRAKLNRTRKVRIFSMSWSDNKNKGSSVYRWLEDNLDWTKYDYSFVGRSPVEFKRIKMVTPQDSMAVAEMLRQHDVFITASKYESCSNAIIEAQACGLPVLYIRSGSNAEVAGAGGLGFDCQKELPALIDSLVKNYELYKSRIHIPTVSQVADEYLRVLQVR